MKKFGSFTVQSFEVPHDNEPCVAYFIKVNGHKLLYATDFEYLPMSFKSVGLNHILAECNHIKEYVDKNSGKFLHQVKGHCSLDTFTEKVVKENITDSLKTVLMLHMSEDACVPSECVNEVQKIVNKDVYVDYCRKGFEVVLTE